MGMIIAVDIGGTQIRVAAFGRGSTEPVDVRRVPTRSSEGKPFERVCEQIAAIWPKNEPVDVIVLAAPGPLNPESGVIFSTPNIEGWENFPMRDKLQKRFGVPALIGNDANMAALGEWYFGAGKGHHHVLYITVSTGIGGGVISGDKLLLGARGLAGEVGHVTVLPDGPLCGCGQRGHLEAVASGPSIVRYVQEQLAEGAVSSLRDKVALSARDISEAAAQGDMLAVKSLARAGDFLGQGLAAFLHLYNPSIVIFGGGVSFSGALLFDPMKAALEKHVMDKTYLKDLQITTVALGDDAGLLGALALGLVSDVEFGKR
jgi:glucokinase